MKSTNTFPDFSDHLHSKDQQIIISHDVNLAPKYSTIFDVVKTGVLEAVEFLVNKYGLNILNERDEYGHTPAHWTCFGGFADILTYMITVGAYIDDPSNSKLGTRPIHWACVKGHIVLVDLLLKAGVEVNAQDLKGFTPLITCCQHNQLLLVGYLLGKGADRHVTDCNGDTALHWATYKGFTNLMRLLINSGFDPQQKDNYGQTPLHLACLAGHTYAVKELCLKDNVCITVKDNNGQAPLNLAQIKQHFEIVHLLKDEIDSRSKIFPQINIWLLLFGPSANSRGPLMFFLLSLFFWGYPMYILRCVPLTWRSHSYLHQLFILSNCIMWLSLALAHSIDPGYLPRNTKQYHSFIQQMAVLRKWSENQKAISRLCHTCQTFRPLRAKHCKVCERCVQNFDHHCPYIYNCVGLKNRVWFLLFAAMVATNCSLTVIFAMVCIWKEGWLYLYTAGLLEAILFCVLGWFITGTTLINAAINLTTNEFFNYKRYRYLKDDQGRYKNPFNKGILKNLEEFFKCSQSYFYEAKDEFEEV